MNLVFLNDSKVSYDEHEQYFSSADQWALKHCASYKGYNLQDVSDVTYTWDVIGCYQFENEQDAIMFNLKWS